MQSSSGTWTVDRFEFGSGETVRDLRLAYTTLGDPGGKPVIVLHGTGGSGSGMLSPQFGELLFGDGGVLDARRHFIVLPDALGHGLSSKPSDGLRAAFPSYDYSDLVALQHRLLTQALGIDRCHLLLGVSMGGMHAWEWACRYPTFMDHLVPLAALPTPMCGRNWMLRRLLVESVRQDPGWQRGDYTEQPPGLRRAWSWFNVASNGGTLALQRAAPTRLAADRWLEEKVVPPTDLDANDLLRQWDSSRNYDVSGQLERIRAKVLAIVSDDDERCPVATLRDALPRIGNGRMWVVPEGTGTSGHGTVGNARHWMNALREFLEVDR